MVPLSAPDLLWIWEHGEGHHPIDQALIILTVACPEKSWEELARLAIGQRDALLLGLRALTFGPRLDGLAECPRCGERLEFTMDASDLGATGPSETMESELALSAEGFSLRFRLPNSLDLAAVVECDGASAAHELLARRCVLEASQGETGVAVEALPEAVIDSLAARMIERDPLSEVQIDLDCPTCGHHWPVILDIVPFFWAEISAEARRLLREVHVLARAYGWREAEILALSARRRHRYLELVS